MPHPLRMAATVGLSLIGSGIVQALAEPAAGAIANRPQADHPTLIAQEFPPEEPFPEDPPPQTFPERETPVFEPELPPLTPPVIPNCVADCAPSLPPQGSRPSFMPPGGALTPLLVIDPRVRGGVFQDLALRETGYSNEFTTYLGLNEDAFPKPEISEIQDNLNLVAEATGVKPAIIYVSFIPSTLDNDDNASKADRFRSKAFTTESTESGEAVEQPSDVLELIVVTPSGPPIRKTFSVTREQVLQTANQLRSEITNRTRLRLQTYLSPAQDLYTWLVQPLEEVLTAAEIGNLAFVMAPGLRSLPVAALHDGQQFLIERYSVGLMPSLSLTDLRYVDVRNTEVLAMGASNFADQPELPAVPLELNTIANRLWPGDFLINETFTPDVLIASRQEKPYGIVHLATHGEFKSGSVDNSYIQFWDRRLGIDQVRALHLNRPPVELMVLSACRTALGNKEAELGFAGLAVQAGVKTALASLWKVDDVGTAGLMTEFYTSLRQEPIKAEALRQAQLAMLRGALSIEGDQLIWSGGKMELPPSLANVSSGDFSHPFFWSAFTVIGSPW